MIQFMVSFIFIVSVSGIIFMLYKKLPVLVKLPKNGHTEFKKPELILKIEKKIKERHFHFFKKQMLLHKILSKSRILILKLEKRVDVILSGIRKKAQELDKKVQNKK